MKRGGKRAPSLWLGDNALLLYLALLKILIHFLTNGSYGIFRDELYYVACSEHLDWGYVDQPPLSILILAATRAVLGDSLFAVRLPAVLTGAACVFLTGLLARELGGRRFAQIVAASSYLIMGTPLVLGSFFSMNPFDHLFWILCSLILVRIIKTGNSKLWLWFGLVAGLGMMNKISIAFLAFGVAVGLLLTSHRKQFLKPWIWLGGIVALIIFLPHLLWQLANGFPTAEFVSNATHQKIAHLSPFDYLGLQLLESNPFTVPIWLAGLGYLLLGKRLAPYRLFALAYLTILVMFVIQNAKAYYLAPAYAVLFAAGGIAFEDWLQGQRRQWIKPVVLVYLLVGWVFIMPLVTPLLSPAAVLEYAETLGINPPRAEVGHDSELPQHFSDRFGWEEMVAAIAGVFHSLSPEEQKRCAIFGGNYGEAGAVDFFGPQYGLPNAISPHNNYWFWGPRDTTGDIVIIVARAGEQEELERLFDEVDPVAEHFSEWALERERTIFICRGLKIPIEELWPQMKRFR